MLEWGYSYNLVMKYWFIRWNKDDLRCVPVRITKLPTTRTQQLPKLLAQQCWELLRLCNPFVMSVRGPYNVGRAVQTDPILVRYVSAITKQKKCWEFVDWKVWPVSNFAQQHSRTCNRVCKRTQHVTSNNVGSCSSTILRPFARGVTL